MSFRDCLSLSRNSLFTFFSSSVIAQVYYCVEEDAVGFDSGKNLKQTDFDEIKFTADIDFEKLYLKSEDLHFQNSLT